MKSVSIVGLGMSADTLTAEGLRTVEQADVLIGAQRMVESFANLDKPSFVEYRPEAVASIVDSYESGRFCVLVSGDTGFYSAAENVCAALSRYSLTVVPGVSSVSYFFSKLMRPWQDAAIVSCHGRNANLTDIVRRNRLTFVLTGGNVIELGKSLVEAGYGELSVYVGENLGLASERILSLTAAVLSDAGIGRLAVLLVENPDHDKRIRYGIPDTEFIRGDVPMTKAETRAVTMGRLALHPESVCCDIGAGTGSVAVEMAFAAYEGQVYALDKSEEAIRLIADNCRAFHIGNVTTILGTAPEVLEGLPPLDAAFIGGGSGAIREVFDILLQKNPLVRIVVNAVTLETLHAATQAFEAHSIVPEIIQLSVTRTKQVGSLHMLQANSPVFILSGGGS